MIYCDFEKLGVILMKIDQNITQIASLKRINSAADDAAGLAISEKLQSIGKGFEQATENTQDAVNLTKVADGAMEGISDQLLRMKELAVQASNGILTKEDRGIIQEEINQIKQGISAQVKNTEFNGIKLIDGSFQDKNIQNTPSGSGSKMNIANTGLEALGIADFDVTEEFNLSDVDNAITKVTKARGEVGAQANRLEASIRSNEVARENTLASQSRIEDLDVAKAMMEFKQNQVMEQYKIGMQQKNMEQQGNSLNLML